MFPILLSLALSRINEVNDQNFLDVVSKNDYSLVLLFAVNFRDGRNAQKVLNAVNHRLTAGISYVSCDVARNPQLRRKFGIVDSSLFFLFHKKECIVQYVGGYTVEGISEFITDALEKQDVHYLKTALDVIEFQSRTPANVIITSDDLVAYADGIAHNCTQLINVGVVTDKSIIEKLKLPPLLYNKPREFITKSFDSKVKVSDLIKLSQPRWNYVTNQNLVGKMTVAVLYNKDEPFHANKINKVLSMAHKELGDRLRYTVIDFFDAPRFVKQFGVFKFSYPIFFVIGQTSGMWQVCNDPTQSNEDIFYWIRQVVTGRAPPSKSSSIIPTLYAQDFMRLVLPPTNDVILFVAAPGMEHYKECKKNAETVAKIFQDCSNVKIYEFNPLTEHVQGLQLPKSNFPQFSVWPAIDPPDGKSFRADYDMKEMLRNIFSFLKAPIENNIAKKTVQRAKELVPGM